MPSIDPARVSGPTKREGRGSARGPEVEAETASAQIDGRKLRPIPKEWENEVKIERRKGFVSRPGKDQWENRLLRVIEGSRGDPCSADLLSTGFNNEGAGFFSRVDLVINELGLAMYFNQSVALCNPGNFVKRVWQPYFKSFDIGVCPEPKRCDPDMLKARLGNDLSHQLLNADRKYLLDFKEFAYEHMFVLKPSSVESVAKCWKGMGFNNTGKHIAVHIRHDYTGGEKPVMLPAETYADAIRNASQEHTGLRFPYSVYVASDDKPAVDKLRTLLNKDGGKYKVYFRYSSDSKSRHYDDSSGISALLADFEAMRTAKVSIGTQSSNVGRTAFYARGRYK